MDIYDQATEKEEQERALSLNLVRARKPSVLPKGHCYNCDLALDDRSLFCDSDCRDDWQARNPKM